MIVNAGIDIGGTNIQSTLFDDKWSVIQSRRDDTPIEYPHFLQILADHVAWIQSRASKDVSIGIGVPGIINPHDGTLHCANLCVKGYAMGADLHRQTGVEVSIVNDSKAFVYSEALLGSGVKYQCVLGLSLGTGLAGGVVMDNKLLPAAFGLSGEFGHLSLPAFAVQQYKLPLLQCGCGKLGCYETFLSGPGLERLGEAMFSTAISAEQWAQRIRNKDTEALQVSACWFAILAELLNNLSLCFDPDCVVFGGGMSRVPDFLTRADKALNNSSRLGSRIPDLLLASGAEHSGARGAALFASRQHS